MITETLINNANEKIKLLSAENEKLWYCKDRELSKDRRSGNCIFILIVQEEYKYKLFHPSVVMRRVVHCVLV
jgi:hypothetical protein